MGQTIERMKQGYSKIRNEALTSAFEYMGLIEHWGSGILRIMQEVRDAGLWNFLVVRTKLVPRGLRNC